jgi:hypothetical protein
MTATPSQLPPPVQQCRYRQWNGDNDVDPELFGNLQAVSMLIVTEEWSLNDRLFGYISVVVTKWAIDGLAATTVAER